MKARIKAWLKRMIQELIKDWIDEAYTLGYEAGMYAQMQKEKEDHNRRLQEIYKYGYIHGVQETREKEGIIELDDLIDDMEGV